MPEFGQRAGDNARHVTGSKKGEFHPVSWVIGTVIYPKSFTSTMR